jgi:tripartite-type tricarboxylate transporter receptor subunit TctC
LAKSRPGELNYGSAGNGSSTHLAIEQFLAQAGNQDDARAVQGQHAGDDRAHERRSRNGVRSGAHVGAADQRRAGYARWLSARPNVPHFCPQLPTVAEAGLKGYESGNWFGIFAPAGTPRAIVDRLNAAINKAMTSTEMKERLQSQGAERCPARPKTWPPRAARDRQVRDDRQGRQA